MKRHLHFKRRNSSKTPMPSSIGPAEVPLMVTKRSRKWGRKALLIAGIAVVALAIAGFLAFLLVRLQFGNNLSRQLKDYEGSLKSVLSESADGFKKYSSEPDPAASQAELAKLIATVQEQIDELPQTPRLLGFSLVPSGVRAGQAKLGDALTAVSKDLQEAKQLLDYEHSVYAIIKKADGSAAKNEQELQALDSFWQDSAEKLKAVTPPLAAKAAHDKLVGAVGEVQVAIAPLAELYSSSDARGFQAQQDVLNAKSAELVKLADEFKLLNLAVDDLLSADMQMLAGLLEE